MFRIISFIMYICMSQEKRESQEFFWQVYENVKKNDGTFRSKISGCILHRLFCESCANIGLETKFADYPCFPHGISGVFISQGAEIGKNCTIFQQVTIGSNMLKDSAGYGAPKIGDNVYIGAGAKIIGNVTIGNNCRIGANCVVTKNVPDNTTVVMEHPRVIVHETERENEFIDYKK